MTTRNTLTRRGFGGIAAGLALAPALARPG